MPAAPRERLALQVQERSGDVSDHPRSSAAGVHLKIVLANGCFDPLHYGHILHLRAARELGRLVVALTSDEAIAHEKPGRPFYSWHERAAILRELRCVSEVVMSDSGVDALHKVRPDIFVKGIDYAAKGVPANVRAICDAMGCEIVYTTTPKHSSSAIVRRIREIAA